MPHLAAHRSRELPGMIDVGSSIFKEMETGRDSRYLRGKRWIDGSS